MFGRIITMTNGTKVKIWSDNDNCTLHVYDAGIIFDVESDFTTTINYSEVCEADRKTLGFYKPEAIDVPDRVRLSIDNGKYTVLLNYSGGIEVLRHGEKWRDCTGDNLIYHLATELAQLKAANGEKITP